MIPPRGLLAIEPQGCRIAFGKIGTARFISFLEGFFSNILDILCLRGAEQGKCPGSF